MVDIGGLFAIVQLATDLFPIAFMILIILFLMAMAFKLLEAAGAKSNLAKKMRLDKKMIIATLALINLLLLSTISVAGSVQAVGLSLDSQVVFGGTIVTLKATGLTPTQEYTVFPTLNTETIRNITFTASDATEYIPVPIPDEEDGSLTLNIGSSTAGAAAASDANVFVSLSAAEDFLPFDLFINLMVPLIVISIIVGIVVAIIKST